MAGILSAQKKMPPPPPPAAGDEDGEAPTPATPPAAAAPAADATASPDQDQDQDQDQSQDQDGGSNATPEEQAQYNAFVGNAYRMIYAGGDDKNPQPAPAILKSLGKTGDPVQDLASTAVNLVTALQQSATQSGQKLSDDVVFQGSAEIIEDLANVAKVAGIHTFTDKELEAASYRGLDLYRQMGEASGQIDPQDLKQQFQVVQEADKRGMLPKLLPGLSQSSQSGQPKDGGQPMSEEDDQQ